MMSNIVLFRTVIGPVTPAIQSGWAPKNENMNAAMNDDKSTSETPYCCVVSMRSSENAIPGSTLQRGVSQTVVRSETRCTYFAKNMRTIAGMTL